MSHGVTPPAADNGMASLLPLLQECVHCGFCLPTCPTYAELGAEADSPRGRIHLLRAMAEGRLEPNDESLAPLDRCLDCRACETACPSGVRYGDIYEGAMASRPRDLAQTPRTRRAFLRRWLSSRSRLALALAPLRLAESLGLAALARSVAQTRLFPPFLRALVRTLPPKLSPAFLRTAPDRVAPHGESRGRVALFVGCVMEQAMGETHAATVRVLTRNGFEVVLPKKQQCCGALHAHSGDVETADELLRVNTELFGDLDLDAIVVNSAGCGAHLQSRLPSHPPVVDAAVWLERAGLVPPTAEVRRVAVYDEPCHLVHGQRISDEPRALLAQIPGLELRPLEEADWCCGAAGLYTATQPELSRRILERKLAQIERSGADLVITANPGCQLQIAAGALARGMNVEVVHLMELLDSAYANPGAV